MRKKIISFILILLISQVAGFALPPEGASLAFGESQSGTVQTKVAEKTAAYVIIDSTNKKIGSVYTQIEKVKYQNIDAYKFTSETSFIRPPHDFRRISEESYVKADDFTIIKSTRKSFTVNNTRITIEIKRRNEHLVLTKTSDDQKIKKEAEFEKEFYLRSTLGKVLNHKGLNAGQRYTLLVLLEDDEPNEVRITVGKKIIEEIVGQKVEGHYCDLFNPDPTSSIRRLKFFVDTNGSLFKSINPDLNLITRRIPEGEVSAPRKKAFERNGRRDIFLPRKIFGPIPLSNDNGEKKGLEEAKKKVREARKHLRQMKKIKATFPEKAKNRALSEKYIKILGIYEEINKTEFEELKVVMANIKAEAESLFEGLGQLYTQAKYSHDQAVKDFNNYNLKGVKTNGDRIEAILLSPEVQSSDEYRPKIEVLLDNVNSLKKRGEIRVEGLKNVPLRGGRITFYPANDISLEPIKLHFFGGEINIPVIYRTYTSRHSLFMNGRFYGAGKKTSRINSDLRIIDITHNFVTFEYKGEEIKVNLK